MDRNIKVEEVLISCPFVRRLSKVSKVWVVEFPYTIMRDEVCLWRYFHPIKLGKGLIQQPKGFDDCHEIGVGVVLGAGPGYYTKEDRWIPMNENIVPGAVIEFDLSMPWRFPEKVKDIQGTFHKLPMCPSVNIFGVYPKE